jgi:hypothetical protein
MSNFEIEERASALYDEVLRLVQSGEWIRAEAEAERFEPEMLQWRLDHYICSFHTKRVRRPVRALNLQVCHHAESA